MIECNEAINFGMPAIKGRRLTVFDIVTMVYYSPTVQDALEDYEIDWQDAMDATDYCMRLRCQSDEGRIQYCDGCLLRTVDEGWSFNREDYSEFRDGDVVITHGNNTVFMGSIQELEDSEFGKLTWLSAVEVHGKLLQAK